MQGKLNIDSLYYTSYVVIAQNETVYRAVFVEKSGVYVGKHLFERVSALAIDQQGTLYTIATPPTGYTNYFLGLFSTPQLYRFNPDQADFAAQWGKDGTADGEFKSANLAVDNHNDLYVVDGYLGRVQKFDQNGKLLAKWSSPELKNITDFQIDDAGNLYGIKGCDVVKVKLS